VTSAAGLDLRERYLAYLGHERRLSPLTCAAYRRDLDALATLAGESPLDRLASDDIRRMVARLHGRGLAGRSLARLLSAWRGFFEWLVRTEGWAANPVAGIKAPRGERRLPAALAPDQAARLVELAAADGLAVRDRAILELFYSSGMRLAELAALDVTAVDLREGLATVTGKGGKTRVVPVGAKAREALERWLADRAKRVPGGERALFVGRGGRRLAHRTIQYVVERRALAQGLSERVHPHVLRHSMASHVLQSSGDLRAVQELLGHASIASTQVYTHLDFQHLAQVYDAAHPRAKAKSERRDEDE
jgi:integrase/recombinase XerC